MSVVTTHELETIFDKSKAYYMAKWEQIEVKGKSPQWNWAAFFLSIFWLFYRRMYAFGFIAVAINLPLVIYRIYLRQPDVDGVSTDKLVLIAISLFFQICIGFYGTNLFFYHIKRKLRFQEEGPIREETIRRMKGTDPIGAIAVYAGFILTGSFLANSFGFSSQLGRNTTGASNIWLESSTGEKEVLTGTGHNYFPEFSPDNKKIAFVNKGNKGWMNIVYDITEKQVIFKQALKGRPNRISWLSKDEILYVFPEMDKPDIVRLNLETGDFTFLTTDPYEEVKPILSPDGKWVLFFQSDEAGLNSGFDLYVMNRESREKKQVKVMRQAFLNDISAFWDNDTNAIVVSNGRSINTYDLNGKLLKDNVPANLTHIKLMYHHPIEQSKYVFRGRDKGRYSLYSLDKRSDDVKRIKAVDKLSNERMSSDGKFIAYEQ